MEQKLQILYNTLMTIETKGVSTKTMSDCLKFTEQLIEETRKQEAKDSTNEEPVEHE